MFSNKKKKSAFTLAEVLIVIGIVGIVAVLTLSTFLKNTGNMENVSAFKKGYSSLQKTTEMLIAENGSIVDSLSTLSSNSDHEGLANLFMAKMKIATNCGTASSKGTGCLAPTVIFLVRGPEVNTASYFVSTSSNYSAFITQDGISYIFQLYRKACDSRQAYPVDDITSPLYNTCGELWIDVNGGNKGPHMVGRDIFGFYLTSRGIIPLGAYPDGWKGGSYPDADCSASPPYGYAGRSCSNKLILQGSMNY